MIEVTENPVEFDVDDEYLEIYAEQLSAEALEKVSQLMLKTALGRNWSPGSSPSLFGKIVRR